MNILQAQDAVNGREGTAVATIPNPITGEAEKVELMELANITITVEKEKTEFKAIGERNTQNKTTGWKGTGSATVRYISSRWAQMLENYVANGVDTYFDILITNEDPGSSTGSQIINVIGCNIDSVDIAKLDIESEVLEQDIDFTFNNFTVNKAFTSLDN